MLSLQRKAHTAEKSAPAKTPRAQTATQTEPMLADLAQTPCPCGGGCPRCGGLPDSVRETIASPGRPLDELTRDAMQQRFRGCGIGSAHAQPASTPALSPQVGVSQPEDAAEQEAEQIATEVAEAPAMGAEATPPNDDAPDFRDIRIHTDVLAARSAQALSANAYAYGRHLVFDQGRFDPQTVVGRRLLAHEMTHTLQPMSRSMIHRDGNGEASQQGGFSMRVTLDGLIFEVSGHTLKAGASSPQIMALILRRLLGMEYKPGVENEILKDMENAKVGTEGLLIKEKTVESKTISGGFKVDPVAADTLVKVLKAKGFKIQLTDEQLNLLRNALFAENAWEKLQPYFPSWYSLWIFKREISQHGKQLGDYRTAYEQNNALRTKESADLLGLAQDNIEAALFPPAKLLDIIREDVALATVIQKPTKDILLKKNRESCSVAYATLFGLTLAPDSTITDPPQKVKGPVAADLLRYIRTQQKLSDKCWGSDDAAHEARVELMGRFGRFYLRGRSGGGDEKILARPAKANKAAWDAVLSSAPPLMPPLYAAALETDHAFTMQLQWQHFTDAMARYAYQFEFIRVPDSAFKDPGKAPDLSQAAGQKPSFGQVANTRLARARRYNAADVERIHQELGNVPFGTSAKDLVEINNALRNVGTVIKLVLDKATEPRYVARIVFPEAGMYIVRSRAVPVLDGDEELVRNPSVACLPVVARNPDEMAVAQVMDTTKMQFDARLRMAEIKALFQSPFPPENADALREEMKQLQAMLQAPQESLGRRKDELDAQIATIKKRIELREKIQMIEAQPEASRDAATLAALKRELARAGGSDGNNYDDKRLVSKLEEQRESAVNTVDMHSKRTKDERGTRFTPNVSFVSDLGHSLQLSIEMYDRGEGDGVYQVYMSDITTPNSGEALGTAPPDKGNPRVEAIKNGLKKLLETSSDYGRGRVAVEVEGQIHLIQVQAGKGRMLSEAVESAAMVASLAAIVAAPLTQGASLYLLLPIGAIGAIPSGYRLYQRYDENRLRLDFAAVMDVLNIVGGVLGLAQAATPLRAVRLGKVLMVMGLGADGAGILMMGAGLAIQLDELRSLPEHERAARMLEILGQAFIQVGIQVGGMAMHARYQSHRTGAAQNETKAKTPGELNEPGFHAPPKETLPADTSTQPNTGDRSMAGAPPSDGTPPAPPKAPPTAHAATPDAAVPKGSPEHLFDKLSEGVDRSLPPPLPADAVKKPASSGEYMRGLTTADAAYAAYNRALLASNGKEVAIYHNPETGEYRVMVGSEVGVRAPEPFGWNALLHYHPNKGNVLTFRLPAPQDFRGLMQRYLAEGVMVREFLEFDIPGVGRGRTEFGIDPASPEPFYVRIHQPDGSSRTLRFAHDGHYSAYWGDRTIAVPKDSPVYDAMIRDIEAYLRSIGADRRGDFGPPAPKPKEPQNATPGAKAPAPGSGGGSAPPPQSKSVAGAGAPAPATHALQSGMGDLTDAGVKFIREKFETTTDSSGKKKISVSSLSDDEIRAKFKNQPNWLEALVLAEARTDWLGRSSDTDFLLSNPKQDFNLVAKRLAKAAAKGKTGHSVHDAILEWNVKDFVDEMLRQNDPEFTAAYNLCENNPDPAFKKRWDEFKNSPKQGDLSGFFLGKVGQKRPDMVEVMLGQNEVHIIDATFAYQDPIHNFKSAFYKTVMQRLINVKTVTALDYRSSSKATPL